MRGRELSADERARAEALLKSSDNLWRFACQLVDEHGKECNITKIEFAVHEFYYALIQVALAYNIAMSGRGVRTDSSAHDLCRDLIRKLYSDARGEGRTYPAKFENLSHLRNVSDYADERADASQLGQHDISIWESIRALCAEKTNILLGKPIIHCN